MLPELENMLQLQELDREIARLDEELKLHAARLDQIVRERNQRDSRLNARRSETVAAESDRRRLEGEMAGFEQELKRARLKQEMVRSEKELQAANHEISRSEGQISRLEEEILEAMEREGKLQSSLAEEETRAEQANTRSIEEQQRQRALADEKEQLRKNIEQDRITAANKLEDEFKETYEWLLKKYGAQAVVPVKGNACGGCGGILVPHLVMKAKSGTQIVQCNHCLRYLRPA